MRYAIIANPKAGGLTVDQKRLVLKRVSRILDSEVHGLDTASGAELARCAVELSTQCDVLVVAGGDGTLANVINAVYPSRLSLAYLPLGTGNAIHRALGYRGSPVDIAKRIRNGSRHACDLILIDGTRLAFMASVGLDGTAVRLWTHYRKQGYSGRKAYFLASLKAYLSVYRPARVCLTVGETDITVERLLSLLVVKQPYFGLGMKVVPKARWDDGRLHTLCVPSGWHNMVVGVATSFTVGNRAGIYQPGTKASVHSERPLTLQIDGDLGWEHNAFSFEVLPGILKLTH